MKISDKTKGYIFVFISVIAISNVYIFSKAALNQVNFPQFGVCWFFFAMVWNFLLFGFSIKLRNEVSINKNNLRYLPILGILELLSTGLFFYAIKLTENPAIVSFVGNIGPIYVIILGYIFLKERFNKWEITGMFLTIAGAIILNYKRDFTWHQFFFEGTGIIFLSSFISAIGTVLAKSKIKEIHPWLLTINRILFIFTGFLTLFLIKGESLHIPLPAFYNILFGSLLGPFLAALAGYYAFRYLKVSKISVIGTFKSFLILAASYFFFGVVPLFYQVAGGILMIVGVIIITMSKA
ncbi:MAG: EamA family transporter, partial [Bacteroidales bacterium]|nr:EamA family transporter [Bacteroidales bacterium]